VFHAMRNRPWSAAYSLYEKGKKMSTQSCGRSLLTMVSYAATTSHDQLRYQTRSKLKPSALWSFTLQLCGKDSTRALS
jgi:hypothetical protein